MSFDLVFSIWLAEIEVLETFFSFISGRVFSFSLFGIFALFMLYQKRYKDLLFVFLALIFGDLIGAQLKDLIQEPRPCFGNFEVFSQLNIIEQPCGSRLTGMPSNHALNFFLFATVFYLLTRQKVLTTALFLIATAVALSRVFLIKHLLSQVIIGAALGIILGITFYNIYKRIR